MSVTMNKYILDLFKFEPFDGTNYQHWSQRTIICFEQLEVDYILFNPPVAKEPEDSATIPKDSDVDATAKAKFDKDNRMDTLEKKYETDDAGIKMYFVGE
ncbi:hypothetical protein J1N35_014951 [Gossypium stocksii]|uniref:Uncharacterized protein n=1 Tax=Gossypium stocksii TaxID=47602 RepID=A0A9D4A9E7_9ROSI|nr:hypothetical protein J1N35_014951 [Gossypium stocksii]